MSFKVLLLAGSREARDLSGLLCNDTRFDVVASFAGVTREPLDLPVAMRRGGFGGRDQYIAYLQDTHINCVIDASHPFAAKISMRSADVAKEIGMPHLQILRPEWKASVGDKWVFIDKEQDAERHIPLGATVFLATGRQTLQGFANLTGRRIICRQIDVSEGPFPFENGEFLIGRPPFSVEDEMSLFVKLGVDFLVVKNAGGSLSASKLVAARQMGLPVILINRPPNPDCARVQSAEQAMEWLTEHVTCGS